MACGTQERHGPDVTPRAACAEKQRTSQKAWLLSSDFIKTNLCTLPPPSAPCSRAFPAPRQRRSLSVGSRTPRRVQAENGGTRIQFAVPIAPHPPIFRSARGQWGVHFGVRRDHLGKSQNHSGTRLDPSGVRRNNFGTRRGHSSVRRGHSGTRRSHSGMRRGHSGMRRNRSGVRRNHSGVRRNHSGTRLGTCNCLILRVNAALPR